MFVRANLNGLGLITRQMCTGIKFYIEHSVYALFNEADSERQLERRWQARMAKSVLYNSKRTVKFHLARKTPAEILSASLSLHWFSVVSAHEKRQLSTEIFETSS